VAGMKKRNDHAEPTKVDRLNIFLYKCDKNEVNSP